MCRAVLIIVLERQGYTSGIVVVLIVFTMEDRMPCYFSFKAAYWFFFCATEPLQTPNPI